MRPLAKKCITIKQIFRDRWVLENYDGKIISEDLYLGSRVAAEEYVKAYVSSYGWPYKICILEDKC